MSRNVRTIMALLVVVIVLLGTITGIVVWNQIQANLAREAFAKSMTEASQKAAEMQASASAQASADAAAARDAAERAQAKNNAAKADAESSCVEGLREQFGRQTVDVVSRSTSGGSGTFYTRGSFKVDTGPSRSYVCTATGSPPNWELNLSFDN
ncbi:hypothetical protein BMF89_21375 [Arthrobacter sp. SRS-W-1-2016]|nr:hypothetical protein BMF89_21375 [Arthrobacter sp. SRS-W-1-2016]